jgi:hypothetical protein
VEDGPAGFIGLEAGLTGENCCFGSFSLISFGEKRSKLRASFGKDLSKC